VQYADDTLIILHADPSQLRRLCAVLDLFIRATGLAMNFHKSTFVPIHVSALRATDLVAIQACLVSSFP
jgi:hypothetical protein